MNNQISFLNDADLDAVCGGEPKGYVYCEAGPGAGTANSMGGGLYPEGTVCTPVVNVGAFLKDLFTLHHPK